MEKSFDEKRNEIQQGNTWIGIEFGSTRIKAVLIGKDCQPLAVGTYSWESSLINGNWTYGDDEIRHGLQSSYASLAQNVMSNYSVAIQTVSGIGLSGMMHGYVALDSNDKMLVPFRTWQNNKQIQASQALTELFNFHIPQRWTIAHLYQAILNKEEHLPKIKRLTTLAGYVHYLLTDNFVVGMGEASGIFPLNAQGNDYDKSKMQAFDSILESYCLPYKLRGILPRPILAGECAGRLTSAGAHLLDVSGNLREGVSFGPPEGDAETGMTATNSIRPQSGNVSAGTSAFAMVVLGTQLKEVHSEIDVVSTPMGKPVAMVHCNNCTTDINAWANLFSDFALLAGLKIDKSKLYSILFSSALKGDENCGELLLYNYFAGEHIVGLEEGRPLLARKPNSDFSVSNLMKCSMFSALAVLRTGMDILKGEQIRIDRLCGHGGFFKTEGVGQKYMAAALNTPITVMETANEGGAWGIALLASFMTNRRSGESLEEYLDKVFAKVVCSTVSPDVNDVEQFNKYLAKYSQGLQIEKQAIETLR